MRKVASTCLLSLLGVLIANYLLADEPGKKKMPLVFSDDFDHGQDRWELTDDKAWTLRKVSGNNVFGLNRRKSDYQPKVRSPHNIALIKNLELSDFEITFKVRSTKDTGNHRDPLLLLPPRRSSGPAQWPDHDRQIRAAACSHQEHDPDAVDGRLAPSETDSKFKDRRDQSLLR